MSARLAVHLPPHQLPELQRAARALLRRPLLTARQMTSSGWCSSWEPVLRNEFGQKLGYRLDVSRSAARLLRRPASTDATRGARHRTNGRPLGRWGYVYLCLTLAALEQPGPPGGRVGAAWPHHPAGPRRRATCSWTPPSTSQRRAFPRRRALPGTGRRARRARRRCGPRCFRRARCSGTSTATQRRCAWWRRRRSCARCRRSRTSSPSRLPSGSEARRRRARHLLNRRMLDQPVVVACAISTATKLELAWRNRRREADNISRLTGCEIELRREGLALIDHPIHPMGGSRFPGSDNVSHAALLWLTAVAAST